MDFGLLLLIAVLQGADVYSTTLVLSRGGVELNPVIAWLQSKVGKGWIYVKIGVILLLSALLTSIGLTLPLLIVAGISLATVINNVVELHKGPK